jgi:formamidopyrimidine-DNA glycosylase
MPEPPVIEAVARTLRPRVGYRRFRCVHVFPSIAAKPQTGALSHGFRGQMIRPGRRQGQVSGLVLGGGTLTMHFGLDGLLIWCSSARPMLQRANLRRPGVPVEVALDLDKGSASPTGVTLHEFKIPMKARPAQSDCFGSAPCLRMLFASRTGFSRSGVVVQGY